MYISGSAAPRQNELEQNSELEYFEGGLLFMSVCIELIKLVHLAFDILLLYFQPGKTSLYWPKYENSLLKNARVLREIQ